MGGTGGPDDRDRLLATASGMYLEATAVRLLAVLRDRSVDALLLKGAALAELLYGDPRARRYADIDLLVDPTGWDLALGVVTALGYEDQAAGTRPGELAAHARELISANGTIVDLHRTLPGATAPHDRVWEHLWSGRRHVALGGEAVPTLGPADSLVCLALNVVNSGPDAKVRRELDVALQRFGRAEWIEAQRRSEPLGASSAFTVGLATTEAGRRRLTELGTVGRPSRIDVVRAEATTTDVVWVERFVSAPWRDRPRLVWDELFPSGAFLAKVPSSTASSGWRARVRRITRLAVRLPAAWRERRRILRRARSAVD